MNHQSNPLISFESTHCISFFYVQSYAIKKKKHEIVLIKKTKMGSS